MIDGLELSLRALVREESTRAKSAQLERLESKIDEIAAAIRSTPKHQQSQFLSVAEAAELSRHSEDTIRLWVKDGRLARYGTERKILVQTADVLNLLSQPVAKGENVIDIQARLRDLMEED